MTDTACQKIEFPIDLDCKTKYWLFNNNLKCSQTSRTISVPFPQIEDGSYISSNWSVQREFALQRSVVELIL